MTARNRTYAVAKSTPGKACGRLERKSLGPSMAGRMGPMDAADTEEQYWDVVTQVGDTLATHAIPLYVTGDHGTPEQVGTAFLLQFRGRHFLVTAAHVLTLQRTRSLFYYVATDTVRALDGRGLINEKDDVGILALGKLQALPQDKSAVPYFRCRPRLLPREAFTYAVVGFPATKSGLHRVTKQVIAAPYVWLGEGVPRAGLEHRSSSEEDRLLIKFNRKKGFSREMQITFPMPNGMNGGPIWTLFLNENSTPVDIELVGVATDHLIQEKTIMGSDIGVALRMIGDYIGNERANRTIGVGTDALALLRTGTLPGQISRAAEMPPFTRLSIAAGS